MFAVIVLVVVLLPSLGHSQERTGNDTLPFTLWLPMVELPGCPYEVEEMRAIRWTDDCCGTSTMLLIKNSELPEDDMFVPYILGEAVLAKTPEFTQVVARNRMGSGVVVGFPGDVRLTGLSNLEQGETYYWNARFVCGGIPGPWSEVSTVVYEYYPLPLFGP
jgi:hypothetical protein